MSAPSAPLRVLCVDDDPSIRALVKVVLERTVRAQVLVADSGESALDSLAAGAPPDVVLLDIMMPGIDGYEVCRRLRKDSRYRGVTIVFLSANADAMVARTRDAGGDDFIPKPFAAAELGKRLLAVVERRREVQA